MIFIVRFPNSASYVDLCLTASAIRQYMDCKSLYYPGTSWSVQDYIKFIESLGFRFRHARDWVSCTERLRKASPLVHFRLSTL